LLTVLAFGGLVVLLRPQFPAELERALELSVAGMLLVLGTNTIAKCFHGRYHFHWHQHSGRVHKHVHFHPATDLAHEHDSHSASMKQPLFVGAAHGLAGTAGATLLVASAIPSQTLGILYLATFGAGSLAAMAVFSAALGATVASGQSLPGALRWLTPARMAAGFCSVAVGIWLGAAAIKG